jgi:hypothetical protein
MPNYGYTDLIYRIENSGANYYRLYSKKFIVNTPYPVASDDPLLYTCPIDLPLQTGKYHSNGIVDVDIREALRLNYKTVDNYLFQAYLTSFTYGHDTNTYLIRGPYTKFIFDLYTNKLIEGFIGTYNSPYNSIPILEVDKIHLLQDPVVIYKKSNLVFLESNVVDRRSITHLKDLDAYKINYEWAFIKHVPMWLKQPSICLPDSLRTLAKYIVSSRIEHKRRLYVGINHHINCPPLKRILLLSCLTNKLSRLQISDDLNYEVNGHLQAYNGFTQNKYYTWYYLPVIQPIEYMQFMDKAYEEYSYLTPYTHYE